ncbi:MAG: hypothetical protein CMG96_06635 [Marinovum sp.]|nr:hypothetical protein [Marinovum sp.]|tara:strand:- start:364 stop:846 length:483 start_codon:yes stop_codon:yes gene_type:complete
MELILQAPIQIKFHIICALYALIIGPVAIFRNRRDKLHRWLGYSWVVALALTALSSFFIFGFRIWGPFSPIHLLSVLTFFGLARGARLIRQGRRAEHAKQMQTLYFLALGIPGVFTLLPGRMLSHALFPGYAVLGFALAVALLAMGIWVWRRFGPLPRAG